MLRAYMYMTTEYFYFVLNQVSCYIASPTISKSIIHPFKTGKNIFVGFLSSGIALFIVGQTYCMLHIRLMLYVDDTILSTVIHYILLT